MSLPSVRGQAGTWPQTRNDSGVGSRSVACCGGHGETRRANPYLRAGRLIRPHYMLADRWRGPTRNGETTSGLLSRTHTRAIRHKMTFAKKRAGVIAHLTPASATLLQKCVTCPLDTRDDEGTCGLYARLVLNDSS
jgi:hypothetical protein